MRFLHTADWHLGRQFHSVPLIDDQAHLLQQVIELARDSAAEAVVVAGDIYDRPLPPPDAVRLLSDFLDRVVAGLGIPVMMIAGNHDSADRLDFGSTLLAHSQCHIIGRLGERVATVTLSDRHGPLHFIGLPYAEPAVVRERTGRMDVRSHDAAMAELAAAAAAAVPAGERSVLVSHCFVAGGSESESERPLSVGGAGNVSARHFEPFSYTALGHLHRPQKAGARAWYSGSLMKYSFSEIGHQKSINVVDIDAQGAAQVEQVRLTPLRDLRAIEGPFAELLESPAPGESRDDYLLVRLTDTQAILDPMGRLREVYPNVLHLERPALRQAAEQASMQPRKDAGDEAVFASFFEQVTGNPLDASQRKAFLEVLEQLRAAEREAGS